MIGIRSLETETMKYMKVLLQNSHIGTVFLTHDIKL
jgi:hypothetical protein